MSVLNIVPVPLLSSWEDVDETLRLMGECKNQIAEIELEMNRKQAEIKQAASDEAQPYQELLKEMLADVKKFVRKRKKELDGKSKKLNHGSTGYRASVNCVIPEGKEREVIKMLKKLDMMDCVDIKETVNRNTLKTYSADAVAQTGAYLKNVDNFWLETEFDRLKPADKT